MNPGPAWPLVGVLAVQGAFVEHEAMLARCGARTRQVRGPDDLEGVDAIVLPGGESTTLGLIAGASGLLAALRARLARGMPALGTCAGMIMLAQSVTDGPQPLVGGIDIEVRRNAFGRQRNSFETLLHVPAVGDPPVDAVFIRAPVIESAGPEVEVLASIDGRGVAARQGSLMVTSFHPELGDEPRFHDWLVQRSRQRQARRAGSDSKEGHVRAQ